MVDLVTGEVNGSSYNPENEVSVEIKNTEAIDYDTGLMFVSTENSTKEFGGTLQSTDDAKGVCTFNVDTANRITGKVYSVNTSEESNLKGNISSDNQLMATSDADDKITGFIDPETLAFTSGVWINGEQQSSGSFAGGGCRLN